MPQDKYPKSDEQKLVEQRKRSKEIYEHGGNFSPIEMIERGEAKKYSAKREMTKAFVILAFVFVLFIAFILVIRFGFKIKNIEVANKTDFYADEVIRASGVRRGESFFFTSASAAEKSIREKIPYVGKVSVKKKFPSTLVISLEKAQGKYYISAGGEYFVLDADRRVIAHTENIEDVELMGCIKLQSKEISSCKVGKKITFYDADCEEVLDELIGLLDDKGMLGFCTSILLDSKFDIRFECYGRYTVMLGDLRDLELKMALLHEVMNDLPVESGGKIDVSDKNLRKAIVTLFN